MKRIMNMFSPLLFCSLLFFCAKPESKEVEVKNTATLYHTKKHKDFNAYWYSGKAEITSYNLSQARYGEIHEGKAVNIFVTENFLPEKQVKADYQNTKNIPVLKLNSTKKFTTGIYPYSLMTSTFSPVNTNEKPIKISFSSQEWCGHTFAQLNNRSDYEIQFYSYFESNTDRNITLKKDILENEIWNTLRISPKSLPIGKLNLIPSFEYLSLHHKKFKAYEAIASIDKDENFMIYKINYPTLSRILTIKASKNFPYIIENWEESIISRGNKLVTTAKRIKTIKSAYWNKNGVTDTNERKVLGLDD